MKKEPGTNKSKIINRLKRIPIFQETSNTDLQSRIRIRKDAPQRVFAGINHVLRTRMESITTASQHRIV